MKKKSILFICPYPENVAPSQRLKFEQYYSSFEAVGYKVEARSFISEDFYKIVYKKGNFFAKTFYSFLGYLRRLQTLFVLHRYDIVYIHLWVTPFGPPIFEWLYRKLSPKIIYDIDDLVYLNNTSKANPIVRFLKGRSKPILLIKSSDHVITCTPYLDQFVRKYNGNTTDISSTINTTLYKPKSNYAVKEKIVIGWSGSHSTSKYLHLLDDVLHELAKSHSFKLLVMGDADFKLDGVEVEALPWKEEYEVDVIKSFDIGLYPLPDEEWILGKSGLKALQYMAAGVPVVATAIGTIHRIIQPGVNGFLVSTPDEWKQALINLMENEKLRQRVGKQAADTVERSYSINANKKHYLTILDRMMND
jgi:glycosyltransferase involved in cell wall biosynthesis